MRHFPQRPRFAGVLTGLLALALVAATASPVAAGPPTTADPYKQKKDVQKQRASVASQINTLTANDKQIEKALAELDTNVKSTKTRYDDAARAAANAAAAAELARGDEAETTANYNRLSSATKRLALDLYVHGPGRVRTPKLTPEQLAQAATHGYLGLLAVTRGQDVSTRLKALRDDLTRQREAAEQAEAAAAAKRTEVSNALGELKTARTQQQKLADAVEARLEAALAESANLAAIDRALSQEIARREAARAKGSKGGAGGNISVGNVKVTKVRGITVATSIADKVAALMDKASADGIPLGGYGYRDSSQQVALRRAHCGTSNYDIYEKPASQCHPPTARPGASMHERGLAIDFTYNGSIITSRSNAGYTWLKANANTYGLYNLPSEPWHWSTNGN